MAVSRPSDLLKNKVNINAPGNRLNEAQAADFVEICALLNEYADVLDLLTGSSTPNAFFGVYTTLVLLQTTHPTAVAGAYAIIDAGVGADPQIALWDNNDNLWVLQQTSSTTTQKTVEVGDNVANVKVTDVNGDEHIIVSGTFEGGDNTKLESYSANSYTRAL